MFIIVILLLQLNIGVFAQGIVDPSTFIPSSCSGNNQWTNWFDSSDPNLAQGEFEVTNHIQQNYPVFMCPSPIAIEVILIVFQSENKSNDFALLRFKL
jgi:hypothetical protein